ncbi:hypothetical protein Lser_V15G15009 [Lactuca serriola]
MKEKDGAYIKSAKSFIMEYKDSWVEKVSCHEELKKSLVAKLALRQMVCSLLHQRYKIFSPTLVQGLMKTFFPRKSLEDVDIDRNLKALKKRSALKLLLELFFDGVIEDTGIFITIIKDLASLEHLKDRDTTHTNLSLLAIFARQARYFIGLSHAGEELVEEGLNITSDQKKVFKKAFHTYHDAAVELLRS